METEQRNAQEFRQTYLGVFYIRIFLNAQAF